MNVVAEFLNEVISRKARRFVVLRKVMAINQEGRESIMYNNNLNLGVRSANKQGGFQESTGLHTLWLQKAHSKRGRGESGIAKEKEIVVIKSPLERWRT